MTSCCPPRPMRWNVVTGAIARCKSKSTGYARKRKSVRAWRWTCGVKPTPKAGNKPWQHCIVHGLDKPGVFTTDSTCARYGLDHGVGHFRPLSITRHRHLLTYHGTAMSQEGLCQVI